MLALTLASHYTAPGTLFNLPPPHRIVTHLKSVAQSTQYTPGITTQYTTNTPKIYTTDNPPPHQKEAVHTAAQSS